MTDGSICFDSKISIHALLAESDQETTPEEVESYISIHALLAESDNITMGKDKPIQTFLSTLSLRRATPRTGLICGGGEIFLSTLSLRRATHAPSRRPCRCNISIHALLAESDYFKGLWVWR